VFSQMTAMFRKNQDGTYQDSVWATCALRTMLESGKFTLTYFIVLYFNFNLNIF
jgi:hypothetical protein